MSEVEVHLWLVRLETVPQHWPDWMAALAPDERARMDRFHRPADAYRFGTSRAVVRRILGQQLGVPANQVAFARNRFGKPRLKLTSPHGLRFNVSHTGGYALIGTVSGRPLGVDLEEIRGDTDWHSLAPAVCTPKELHEIEALPERDRASELLRYWTLKEAYVKALGMGLSYPHRQVEVVRRKQNGGAIERALHVRGRWSVFPIEQIAGYAGAVVVWGEAVAVQQRSMDWS